MFAVHVPGIILSHMETFLARCDPVLGLGSQIPSYGFAETRLFHFILLYENLFLQKAPNFIFPLTMLKSDIVDIISAER